MSVIAKARAALRRRFAPSDRRVDFVVAGTQKGGTTALDACLRAHPQLCMAERKELHFFDDEVRFADGPADYRDYHKWFRPEHGHRLLGESTPIYLYWRSVPQRIHAYDPAMRWIVVLRNPIERAHSHWNMERQRGADPLPFAEAVQRERERCAAAAPLQHRVFSYVDRGHYVEQLRRVWALFPRDRVLVLRHDELRQRPQASLDRVFAFLGVDACDVPVRDVHSRAYEAPMDPATRRHLRDVFAPGVRELERELGWDCSDWLRVPDQPDHGG